MISTLNDITHLGHENKRNDHQLKRLLIIKQILLIGKFNEDILEDMHIDVGV